MTASSKTLIPYGWCIITPDTVQSQTLKQTQTLIVTFKSLGNKQGCIFLVAWVCLDYSKDYLNLSWSLWHKKTQSMRLKMWNNDEVKVTCFIIPEISAHLTFKMSLWPTFYGHHSCSKIWANELICMVSAAKPRFKKMPVLVCLWAPLIVISHWVGINHKLFRSALTWIMRKVGQDRWHCAYQYSIEWRKVICLFWQFCVLRDKGLPRWLLRWSSQPELENQTDM